MHTMSEAMDQVYELFLAHDASPEAYRAALEDVADYAEVAGFRNWAGLVRIAASSPAPPPWTATANLRSITGMMRREATLKGGITFTRSPCNPSGEIR